METDIGSLITQLERKLNDENVALQSRLEVALTVFSSSEIPIIQKEEYVFSWVLKSLSECKEEQDRELLYSFLLKCLQSKRLQNFNGNMKATVIEDLLSALKHYKKYPDCLRLLIRSCCVEIIQISFFQRWFMCDPENVCRATAYYLKSIKDEETASDFINFIDNFLYIHKMSLLKGELRSKFVKDVFKEMGEALTCILPCHRKTYFEKAIQCCKEVILYEPKYLDDYLNLDKTMDEEVKLFRKKLKHLPTKESKEVVELCYSLLLHSVISKYPDEHEKIFKVFVSLCPFLGIVVNTIVSIEMNPVTNWDIENSFDIIVKLIDILDGSNMPLTCQLGEITLQTWFTSLIIGLSNINNRTFSCNFLNMIKRIYEFNPLVIEPTCKIIAKFMLQIKKIEVKSTYLEYLRSIFKGSSKIQRLQKFIAFLLENIHDCLMSFSCEDDLLFEDVLPEVFCYDIASAFSALPSIQILAMMRSFTFHLQRDCLYGLEFNADKLLIINYAIICELLTILLSSANIIDHSVPETVKSKYKLLLEDLQALLKPMGSIFQELHDDRMVVPFLKLCREFGEVKLLFREYENIAIVPPMAVDLEPTNISYVHNYLDPEGWGSIALRIEEHSDCAAANHFYELLIQKVGAVSQVEEGSEGPGTQVARYLLSTANVEWLWKKILTLAPLFHSRELTKLINKVVKYLGDDQSQWQPLMKQEALTENRCLVLGLALCLMYRASKKLEGEDGGVSRLVLALAPPTNLLDYELSQLILDDPELKEAVEEPLAEMAAILNENLPLLNTPTPKVPHISMFEVPARLPVHHLSALSQSCALLSATALLYDLPPGSEADGLLFNLLLKILDGPEKNNPSLLNELNPDTFLRFIAIRGKDYRGQRKLMKRICNLAFRSKKSSKQLFREVDEPSVSEAWITALVIDCLIQLKKKFIGGKECQKPLERRKCLDRLIDALIPVLTAEPPSLSHLYSFTVVFSYILRYHSSQKQRFSQLSPLLQEYINLAVSNYKEGERLIESLIEHRSELGEEFPSSLLLSTFHQMKIQVVPPTDSTSDLLFATATITEFKNILTQMVDETKLDELDEAKSRRLLLLWSQLLSGLLSGEKSRERDKALHRLLEHSVVVSHYWAEGSAHHLVLPLMNIISTLCKNSGVNMNGGIVDCCLELCGVVPLSPCESLLEYLGPLLDALSSLFRYRPAILADRLPAFLQRYRRCLTALPPAVPQTAPYSVVKRAVPLANKMERLATSMVKKAKDFSRLSPYLIADLMNIFQHHTLAPDVKFVYENISNAFLSISDKHAITFLKSVLPTGQQELFNRLYENYNKFHRFVGKI